MQGTGMFNGATLPSQQKAGFPRAAEMEADDTDDFDTTPINIRTVLQLERESIAYWNNMTCFFNKWWFPEPDRITLPFCFFHVVKYSETDKVETSQKRVIMYEPPEANPDVDLSDPVRKGLMQTMVDNVVRQPKTYKMEIIVPFMPFGRHVKQGVELAKFVSGIGSWLGNVGIISPMAVDYLQGQFANVLQTTRDAQYALDDQIGAMENEIRGILNSDTMINKNSLDAMFERGNVLQMKTWMGFDYKYVIITDKTAEKRGQEDDVWRVSIDLKELPILSLTPVKDEVTKPGYSWTIGAIDKIGTLLGTPRIRTTMPYYKALGEKEEADGSGT